MESDSCLARNRFPFIAVERDPNSTNLLVFTTGAMSSTTQNNGLGKDYNLSQIVALAFTYRHILEACKWFPALTMLAPIGLKVVFFLADLLTKNHSFLTVVSTVCVTALFRQMTRSFAPSAKQAEEDLARFKLRIPFGVFTLMTLIVRFVIVRFEESLGRTSILTWSPGVSFRVAFQLALGMSLLGISVIFQYIGPASVGEFHLVL